MASTKTSGEAVATTLSGSELLRCVQGGSDKRTTINAIVADKGLVTLTGAETLTNKTLITPNLGTPSAITLTNATDDTNKRLMSDVQEAKLDALEGSNKRVLTDAELVKLTSIEALADVTDPVNVGAAIHGSTNKATPIGADKIAIINTASGNTLGYSTLTQLIAQILTTNSITTAMLQDAAVGNAKLATMGANTVKLNATASTAAPVNGSIGGGLRMDGTSKIIAPGSTAFSMLFDTQTTTTDPGSTKCNFNATGTVFVVNNTTLGGRDLDDYFGGAVVNGKLHWKSNNFTSAAWGEFQVTSAAPGVGNTFWSFGGTSLAIGGSLPTDGEEILIWYERISSPEDVDAVNKSYKYLRRDAQNQIIDENGVVISGTAAVADYTALQALDEAAYENFAVVVDNMAGKPVFLSDGANFLPMNGGYNVDRQNTSVKKVVCANSVTWTPTNNGGTVQLAGTAHGLTSAAIGYSLYLTNTPANWVAGSFHEITAITDANTIQVSTAWVASMGTPTFALVTTKIPVLALTVPPLRANSRYLFDCALLANTGPTTNRIQCLLGSVELTLVVFNASSNASLPVKAGFKNLNSVSAQSGLYGKSSSGSGGGSANIVMDGVGGNPAGVDTSTGSQVFTVSLECQTVDEGVEMGGYIVRVEG